MKLKFKIIIFAVLAIIALGVTSYFIFFNKEKTVTHIVEFKLNEPIEQNIEVNTEYEELGTSVTIDGVESNENILIDTSELNIEQLGTYKVKYYVVIGDKEYSEYRNVSIVDTTVPIITLTGSSISLIIGEDYKELGYEAHDNYDGDITDSVEIENNINSKKAGSYVVTYKALDSSGNETTVSRKVIVKVPNKVISVVKEEKIEIKEVEETKYRNTVTHNKFTSNGIHLEGYIKDVNEGLKLYLKGETEYSFELSINGNNYTADINLNDVPNGNYKVYIGEETLLNEMAFIEKLSRAKVNDKLISLKYPDNEVEISIDDFSYLYDIVIDPGHGGKDPGASNEYITEKEMNLTVSQYEKCRYEAHGLKVYMTRTGDTTCNYIAKTDENLREIEQRGYEIGYYGAVSKVVYSNHHNSINNNFFSGYEILLPSYLSKDGLDVELNIANKFNNIYPLTESHKRFYSRDYDTSSIVSKLDGDVYSFRNYYAIIRIPYEIFNIKSVIYEGIYMSNKADFNWYWTSDNWIKASEIKIEEYVKSLGVEYDSDNSGCLQ